jgi:uncharacterized SAM-binding protein YcdF (DUF218 family)
MFLFKKIVSPLFLPLTLSLILLLAGLILFWLRKKEGMGKILMTFGVLLLALMSYDAVSSRLIMPLECRYPPASLSEVRGARWIAVLGAGIKVEKGYPATSQLSKHSLASLAEGIRLQRHLPGCKLLLSGGAVFQPVPEAEVMAGAARELGVSEKDMVLESASRDTEEQARRIRNIVGRDKFILVTSAAHMPRSMALFRKEQMKPIPAPAGVCVKNKEPITPDDFYPGASALWKSETAFHEYLGIVWAKLRGKI